jgi:hypothetical protein
VTRNIKIKNKIHKKNIESIKYYKKRNFTNNDISNITGANLNKIKEIVKANWKIQRKN